MNSILAAHESSLLLTLEEISQLVSHSHDPRGTLKNIVSLIQERFKTDVCSAYVFEPDSGELVLGATVGLKAESVGGVRMRLDEGLTGLVAERLAPVMVADAFKHPRFKYFPDAGEDMYHSFLGVPLVEGGVLQGVLVVQTAEPRTFSSNETRMLVTVGSQLAPLVSEALILERLIEVTHDETPREEPEPESTSFSLQGVSLSPGLGVGQVYVVDGFSDDAGLPEEILDAEMETLRLRHAMAGAQEDMARVSQQISSLVGEDHGAILQAQMMILQDRTIENDLLACITAGCSAVGALRQVLERYEQAFKKLSNPFFQERVFDIKDVFRRILWQLRPSCSLTTNGAERLVILAKDASVMDLFSVDLKQLAGVIVESGGPQSHAAILARSLGVPMVGQVADCVHKLRHGRQLLVNGQSGMVYLDPPAEIVAAEEASLGLASPARQSAPAKAMLAPGLPRVEVNINLLSEVAGAVEQQATGVGLYRSEFLFLARRTPPTEEEQFGIYCKLLQQLDGRPVSIRTFDLRPDKVAHYSHLTSAAAQMFDWRLVLDSPPVQDLFKAQVRAILRAAEFGPARILVPFVTRSEHMDFILSTLQRARDELRRDGLAYGRDVPLGIMIEVPAATTMVEPWAADVDFFALGTNDLVATSLGIDRDDPVGASRDDPLHPGVLRLIREVIAAAHRMGRQVSVCGEMAADPEGIIALAVLQADSLSVPVNQLGIVRGALMRQSAEALRGLERELLFLRSAVQAREFLRQSAYA